MDWPLVSVIVVVCGLLVAVYGLLRGRRTCEFECDELYYCRWVLESAEKRGVAGASLALDKIDLVIRRLGGS